MKIISKYILILFAVILVAFSGHFAVLNAMGQNAGNSLFLTYGFNLGVTVLILFGFSLILKKKSKQIGSVFLISSLIKFLLFFSVITPFLKTTGSVKSYAFAAFFIPYAICLIVEVLVTIKLLKQLDADSE